MLRNRNTLILAGAALAAFLGFLVFGAEERGAVSGEEKGGGFLGWFGGSAGSSGSKPSLEGSGGEAGRARERQAREAKRKLLQRKSGKKQSPADPNLVERMAAGLGGLVPSSARDASREGMLTQSFRGAGGGSGTEVRGGGGATQEPESDDVEEPASTDPNKCGSPKIKKSVFNLQTNPMMRKAFDVPSKSVLISHGFGERFSVGGGPAFVIYIPQSKRGSAAAIFDDRFLVTITGECIPDRQFLKSLLHQ